MGISLDISPPLERLEGIIHEAVERLVPRLGHDHFDGRLTIRGVLREQVDDEKEQQFPFGAEDGVKAPRVL